ncbi:uncharacterized protein LOC117782777 [Drosophila innubila]|uniref:uncharacterized protein LOC117782777 n=1 Tax=Drosophila innubila TaxID=198719 RepID=UPI00148CD08E|nr:uncharacterized protein LOC117782777 [Drosophila innubila]
MLRQQLKLVVPTIYPRCCYHWGNYDASSGGCCRMQTKCTNVTVCGPTRPIPNVCSTRVDADVVLAEAYPKQLMEILSRAQDVDECDLYKHDVCFYRPSDKNRRYQRTWCECPRIWLRPKPTCCFDKEYCLPIERRQRPPPKPELSEAEVYAFQMAQLCKYTSRLGSKTSLKCQIVNPPHPCQKTKAPFPSFSECDPECIPHYCPTECACKLRPSLCDMWRLYHLQGGVIKKCTNALINNCPYKNRARTLL